MSGQPFFLDISVIDWAAQARRRSRLPKICTSQQKVDTFFIFYTLKTEHSTPYIVLVSNSLMSMQVFLH